MSTQETANPILNSENVDGLSGDEVVISGISGLFPSSNNVVDFMNNLYNKVDMTTEDDFYLDRVGLPKYSGKISGIHKFDNQFFRVPHKQADDMDPIGRKLLEQTYCAMFDAGVNPLLYKGKRVGVYVCALYSETVKYMILSDRTNAFATSGSSKAMLANRISFWLDSKGPSHCIESPSGILSCLEKAYHSIKFGDCEAAIVGGGQCFNDAMLTANVVNTGVLSFDGKTRCFDKNGNGHVNSQAVCVLFLQKAKGAKRIYAEVCNVEVKYDLKQGEKFSLNRKPETIVNFLNACHRKSGISPDNIEYVEANGAAIPEADANELKAISQVYGNDKPIMVGCVKSNMGSNEAVSGACAITKLCLAYHKGKLAGNLHYNDPLDIPAIQDDTIKVLTENTSFQRGYTAMNHFTYTGTNSHVLLKGHFRPKIPNRYKIHIPYLVPISGRHERGLEKVFEILESQPLDPEVIGMLQDIYQVETPGFTYRGYTLLDSSIDNQTISLTQSTELYQGARRPLWLVYSGMGSQWPEMGKELMRIPIFAAAIEKCRTFLEPKGVDIVRILTDPDKTILDNVLNCFVGIAAVQIGLTDILKEMGLVPDNIIGHSLGEMGCAYFDGCFSAEQMILTAYARGLVSIKSKLIRGAMAAVGLGYQEMVTLCRPEIDIACHNSNEFCTISGPVDIIKTFVAELNQKGIFAKEVPCGNIAYHSRYIQDAGPAFLKLLKEIIKSPLKRSKKWISTSYLEENWNEPIAELSSAEYHTNNLLGPVYFEEAARLIPNNAVVVEIAPHGLMQAILKRSHPGCTHISLTRRSDKNPLRLLFESFGKLYQEGHNLKVSALYPKIEYPVSTETSPLPHLVEWYHEHNWTERLYKLQKTDAKCITPSRKLSISILDDEYKFITGHVRGGNIVIPEAAILFYVWETLAMYERVNHKDLSVTFRDVQFYAEVIINADEIINLQFTIFKGNNNFEVTRDSNILIASGNIKSNSPKIESRAVKTTTEDVEYNELSTDDIYKMMYLKGHLYQKEFQSIHSSTTHWENAKIKMTGNWITFLDALIQLNILTKKYDGISVPRIIKILKINMIDHASIENNNQNIFYANFDKCSGVTKCGGVTIDSIVFNHAPLFESEPAVLKCLTHHSFTAAKIQKENRSISKRTNHYKLVRTKSNSTDDLKWMKTDVNYKNSTLKVSFAGPSLRDVQNVIGLVEIDTDFGMDFSGIDSNGNRVMGLVAGGALASIVELDQDLLWPVPNHWTLEEAATVPLPYVHAFYCLTIRTYLHAGLSVFVTGGAGALGQAVISICLSLGCTVYTSVGDIGKKMFLMKLFPDLKETNIGYSYDINFWYMVIQNSKKHRCDIVINCATGLLREFAMMCVGSIGHFLDISKYDMKMNKPFGMGYLQEDISYKTVDLSNLFRPENAAEKKLLRKVISDGISNGVVKPISYVVYPVEDVGKAFKLLSLCRHRGRALIKFGDSNPPIAIPRTHYCSTSTYLVHVGEQIYLGAQLITHLVKNGARKFILNQTSLKFSGFLQAQNAFWKKLGATVTISCENLKEVKDCIKVFKNEENLNGIFIVQSISSKTGSDTFGADFSSVVSNLDKISRNNFPKLRYFVILASTSTSMQKNASDLEEICERRAESGHPALLVRAALFNNEDHLLDEQRFITCPLTTKTVLQAMEQGLYKNYANVLTYNESKDNCKIYKKIAKCLGILDLNAVNDSLYVKDFICNEINYEELKMVVKDSYNIELPTENLKELTIYSLKQLSKSKIKSYTNFDSKFAAFYNFIDDDINNATEIFIPMPTLTSTAAEKSKNLNIIANNLMLIPGFEGHHHIFKELCERLKIEATTVQLAPDVANKTIQEIALDLKKRIKNKFILKPKFYLLGYSFGVNVALEIASLLEKDGLVGVVYCLDSSPDALREQLDAYLKISSETELQNYIIKHLYQVMSKQDFANLEDVVQKLDDWDEKVAACVEKLKGIVNFSNQYKTDIIKGLYNRISFARSYSPKFKLESKIVLLKGIPHPKAMSLSADYCLSKYAKNPVEVLNINSDVVAAPYDITVANIVNRFLDPSLLEEFKTLNFCESYSKA